MRTNKNTHTHTPNNRCGTPTHTPHTYSILPGPGTDTPEEQPAPGRKRWSPSFQDVDRQTASAPVQTSAGTAPTRNTLAQTSPQRPPSPSKEGTMNKRGVHLVQTSPPTRAIPGQNSPNHQ
ncbi:hypothetical protein GOODEAATRI_027945 [Goodea atripinnis]|uniref:Uncharacterized protein n=1 Tax=Goodea atripinnis TaxID=208336 RepID=A0ABV0NE97_9TELE